MPGQGEAMLILTRSLFADTPEQQKNGQANTQCDGIVWKAGGKCHRWFKLKKKPGIMFSLHFFSFSFIFC